MADQVLITLTTAGAATGPFDLYSNLDGYTTAFETGVSQASLVAGYLSVLVPTGTTTVRVTSTGSCTNHIDISITGITTTTTTTTAVVPTLANVASTLSPLGTCNVIGTTSIYLDAADNAAFVANSNCFLAGMVARNVTGSPLAGTIEVFDTTTCLVTWHIISGVMALRTAPQGGQC
jgi:hypothetical protein